MNPQYKEISYHQLMKKIEVLNELNLEEGIGSFFMGNKKERDAIFDKRRSETGTANQARPENLRLNAAKEDLRMDPTPENEAKMKAAQAAVDITDDADQTRINADNPIPKEKSGVFGALGKIPVLGGLGRAYVAAAKNKMSRSEGIGAYLTKDSQDDTRGSRKMTQNDCAQLKLDTIPGKWPSVKVRYGCKN